MDARESFERIAREAADRRATGVFLVPGEPPAYRVGGRIVRADEDPLGAADVAAMAAALFGEAGLEDLGAASATATRHVRVSDDFSALVSAARSGGEITLAAHPVRHAVVDVETIRVPEPVVRAVEATHGLVLVTGPAGSGKTTTAYALLEHLNATRDVHIVTASYWVEYLLEPKRALVQRRHVGVDVPDMLAAIRSAMLQDPDVLFVAEIREIEVLAACLSAAETGHLVITQLHQPTPEAAIRRILELQPADLRDPVRGTLSRVLRCAVAQRLLPRADGKGQLAAYGYLVPDEAVRRAIAPGGDLDELETMGPPARRDLEDHVAELVGRGEAAATAAEG